MSPVVSYSYDMLRLSLTENYKYLMWNFSLAYLPVTGRLDVTECIHIHMHYEVGLYIYMHIKTNALWDMVTRILVTKTGRN